MSTAADVRDTEEDIFNDNNLHASQQQTSRKGICSTRHGLSIILMLCNFAIYTQQMNMSIAIPAMVNHTAPPNHPNASTERPPTKSQGYWNETQEEFKTVGPVYDWRPETQGIILSSLNYASFLAPLPTGYVAGVFGAKRVVGAGLFISSVLTLFIPLAAATGVTLLVVIRAVQGIAQVMVTTGQYAIWAKWAPPKEKSQLTSIAVSGIMLGSFTIFSVGGLLCQTIGWPHIFYIFGVTGCICCLLWFSVVYDDPMNHPFISTGEKEYIRCALTQKSHSPSWSLPIMAMIKSLPLWAILIYSFCQYWNFYVITNYRPTYINSVLQANLRDSGILSALPLVPGFICTILGGLLADYLFSRKILKLITVRKLFTAIGALLPSLLNMSLYWVRSSISTSVAFLILSPALNGLCVSGALVNILDIAPRYVGFLRGLSQVFAHAAGAVSPTTTGFFLNQDSDLGWRNVFLLSAAVNIFGVIIYLIFSQADVQDWAKE